MDMLCQQNTHFANITHFAADENTTAPGHKPGQYHKLQVVKSTQDRPRMTASAGKPSQESGMGWGWNGVMWGDQAQEGGGFSGTHQIIIPFPALIHLHGSMQTCTSDITAAGPS